MQIGWLYSEGLGFADKMPRPDPVPTLHLAAAAELHCHDSVVSEDHKAEWIEELDVECRSCPVVEDRNLENLEDNIPLRVSVVVEVADNLVVTAGKAFVCSPQKSVHPSSLMQVPYTYKKIHKAKSTFPKLRR